MLIGLNLAVTRLMLARGAAPAARFPSGWTHRAPIVIQESRIDNASTLTPDPLYSAFHDSHPPPAKRIARLRRHASSSSVVAAQGAAPEK